MVKVEVKKKPNSDEHGGIWGGGGEEEEVGTCNKAEMRLWMEMQVEAAGAAAMWVRHRRFSLIFVAAS